MEEARAEVIVEPALDRQFTIASFYSTAWSDNAVYVTRLAHIIDGMRKAGVPEK